MANKEQDNLSIAQELHAQTHANSEQNLIKMPSSSNTNRGETNESQFAQATNDQHNPNDDIIPNSVKGAPESLKPAIRKKQNKESARRSRQKRLELFNQMAMSLSSIVNRVSVLENRLMTIEQHLQRQGIQIDTSEAHMAEAATERMTNTVFAAQKNTMTERTNSSFEGQNSTNKDREMDDIDLLVEQCLNQMT